MPPKTKSPVKKKATAPAKKSVSLSSLDDKVYAACDIMRRSNCSGATNYVPELTWILFLRILDELEARDEVRAAALRLPYRSAIEAPYRWRDWAATPDKEDEGREGTPGWKRHELTEGKLNQFKSWVNAKLIPYLRGLRDVPNASSRQKVISEILSDVERVRIDTDRNLLDVLDKVHEIHPDAIDDQHVFTLSQVYEGLLADLGEKGGDGGQFFTPREIVRATVRVVDPKIGETVYDPGCGTGGFLAQAYEHMAGNGDENIQNAQQLETLKNDTFYGREKENLVYPIALANLVLHGIDFPHVWHGNTLTGDAIYEGLFQDAPAQFDVILSNPPFGGKEGTEAQSKFAYKTRATQVLFLQHVIDALADDGRCGIVLDEGLLFRTNEEAFVKTKRKLTEECDLYCIVSLPGGAFAGTGAGVKTNLLFFDKGKATTKIWYYDLSDVKVGKRTPFTLERFKEFFELLPERGDSDRSWTVDFVERQKQARDSAAPYHKEATRIEKEIDCRKETLKKRKKEDARDTEIEGLEAEIKGLLKEAREATNRALAIEDAVYDLKAVNPNGVGDRDERTPGQLLAIIEEQGRVISDALKRLRKSGLTD